MSKTMLMIMRVAVDDLADDKRKELADDMCVEPHQLTTLEDAEPLALARMVATHIAAPALHDDLFAGSDEMVRFVGADVVAAVWE